MEPIDELTVYQGNILNNFSPDDLLINVARFCFGANMSTTSTYPTALLLLMLSPAGELCLPRGH